MPHRKSRGSLNSPPQRAPPLLVIAAGVNSVGLMGRRVVLAALLRAVLRRARDTTRVEIGLFFRRVGSLGVRHGHFSFSFNPSAPRSQGRFFGLTVSRTNSL